MFADGLEEFDASREVVQDMIDEYHAMEGANYATFGEQEDKAPDAAVRNPALSGKV